MNKIGIRTLKNSLSKCLKQVKGGAVLHISEWGQIIAYLVPAQEKKSDQSLLNLVETGLISWEGGKPKGAMRPISLKGKPLSTWIVENRR